MSNFGLEIIELRHKRYFQAEKGSYQSWPRSRNARLVIATGADPAKEPKLDAEVAPATAKVDTSGSTANAAAAHTGDPACQTMQLGPTGRTFVPGPARKSATAFKPKRPPLLWTFPGSGNTWCRMLLEQATGWLTGSVYNDPSLKRMFRAEGMFARRDLVAVKVHPNVKNWNAARVQTTFGAAPPLILVVRDPFRAIWSEGQRRITRFLRRSGRAEGQGASHTQSLTRAWLGDERNWAKWVALATRMAADYYDMWVGYETLIDAGSPYVFIAYEDLTEVPSRHGALQRMIAFIGDAFEEQRVGCAFDSAENKNIRRPPPGGAAEDSRALLHNAYPADQALACDIWKTMTQARAVAQRLGYAWKYTPPVACPGV